MVRLTHNPIDYHALTEAVRGPHYGAVALFLGTVRDLTGDQVTEFLVYEAYPPMAEKKMAEIEAEVRRRWTVGEVALVHRIGRLGVGEVSVAVAVSALHRAAAFDACRYAIDTLKELVPIWKKETAPDGVGGWVHPTSELRNAECGMRNKDTIEGDAQ
ncbi:MAG: molybdopterin converting factor [Gemmataceae bacterium]|nr:molybdopterin converting factor [Gemmataceae bacterium]